MRNFESGAYRSEDTDKLDYEACLSPRVLRRYAEYKRSHRKQANGKMRADDNWQQGMPLPRYMKSLCRHLFDVWGIHRGDWLTGIEDESMEELLCAVIFNAQGYLHTILKGPSKAVGVPPRSCSNCNHVKSEDCGHSLNCLPDYAHWKPKTKTPVRAITHPCSKCLHGAKPSVAQICVGCFATNEHKNWEPKTKPQTPPIPKQTEIEDERTPTGKRYRPPKTEPATQTQTPKKTCGSCEHQPVGVLVAVTVFNRCIRCTHDGNQSQWEPKNA